MVSEMQDSKGQKVEYVCKYCKKPITGKLIILPDGTWILCSAYTRTWADKKGGKIIRVVNGISPSKS